MKILKAEYRDHTFVICAYKESEYLEKCIVSIMDQSVKSNVLMATSTDNSYIRSLAEKYDIPLKIANRASDIALDWNFAYASADSKYVTIAHQDDVYEKDYLKEALKSLKNSSKPLIFFSQYYEIRNKEKIFKNKNLKIKKILLWPLKFRILRKYKIVKRSILSLGNPICCPAVTYNKENLPEKIFNKGFKSNIDWETWENLSKLKGDFLYYDKPLMGHRVHEKSTTTEIINSNLRTKEDLEMLKKFWPCPIAKMINKIYKSAEQSNH